MTEAKRKKLFKELKTDLTDGWGKKCKDFHPGCITCQLHHALETVEFFIYDGLPPKKQHQTKSNVTTPSRSKK